MHPAGHSLRPFNSILKKTDLSRNITGANAGHPNPADSTVTHEVTASVSFLLSASSMDADPLSSSTHEFNRANQAALSQPMRDHASSESYYSYPPSQSFIDDIQYPVANGYQGVLSYEESAPLQALKTLPMAFRGQSISRLEGILSKPSQLNQSSHIEDEGLIKKIVYTLGLQLLENKKINAADDAKVKNALFFMKQLNRAAFSAGLRDLQIKYRDISNDRSDRMTRYEGSLNLVNNARFERTQELSRQRVKAVAHTIDSKNFDFNSPALNEAFAMVKGLGKGISELDAVQNLLDVFKLRHQMTGTILPLVTDLEALHVVDGLDTLWSMSFRQPEKALEIVKALYMLEQVFGVTPSTEGRDLTNSLFQNHLESLHQKLSLALDKAKKQREDAVSKFTDVPKKLTTLSRQFPTSGTAVLFKGSEQRKTKIHKASTLSSSKYRVSTSRTNQDATQSDKGSQSAPSADRLTTQKAKKSVRFTFS